MFIADRHWTNLVRAAAWHRVAAARRKEFISSGSKDVATQYELLLDLRNAECAVLDLVDEIIGEQNG